MSVMAMDFEKARFNMIQQQIRPWDVLDPEVLKLLSVVKREDFVPVQYKELAFADVELPLSLNGNASQTMLAPRMEARMLQELNVKNSDKVLEIGAGSGYMAALLAAKAQFVFTVDIDPAMVEMARRNLTRAGVANVSVDLGDAAQGWDLYAPYDVIVVSASLPTVPESMLRSLKVGGRLVAVVGSLPTMEVQLITRTSDDAYTTENVFETAVAPLVNAKQLEKFVF